MSSRQRAKQWPYPRYSHFQKAMRRAAKQWFLDKGYAVNKESGYILSHRDSWSHNMILPDVARYIEGQIEERAGFPLHKYIHHGLSSQAMVINLIAPLIVHDDMEIFLSLLIDADQDSVTSVAFEYEDRTTFNEDSGQPTSIDLLIQTANKQRYFIESKFTEAEFGGCSVFAQGDCDGHNPSHDFDSCYLHFIGRRYWDLMQKHGFITPQIKQSPICIFTAYYQFFREVLFALENDGIFILLYDERNPAFYKKHNDTERGLYPFLQSFIPEQHQVSVRTVTVQQVVSAIKASNRHSWINEFEVKYGLS